MTETVLKLNLASEHDEHRLAQVVEEFAQWRAASTKPNVADWDGPDIMVKTAWTHDAICKTLIFQEASWVDKFLDMWSESPAITA